MFDYSAFLGLLATLGISRRELASKMNVDEATLSKKLRALTDAQGVCWYLQTRDIDKIIEILNLPLCDVGRYFFTRKVQKDEQKG